MKDTGEILAGIKALWPHAEVKVESDAFRTSVHLDSRSSMPLTFAQLATVAVILDSDKFDIVMDSETERYQISEVTWDSDTTYTMRFYLSAEDYGVWSAPSFRELAIEKGETS